MCLALAYVTIFIMKRKVIISQISSFFKCIVTSITRKFLPSLLFFALVFNLMYIFIFNIFNLFPWQVMDIEYFYRIFYNVKICFAQSFTVFYRSSLNNFIKIMKLVIVYNQFCASLTIELCNIHQCLKTKKSNNYYASHP